MGFFSSLGNIAGSLLQSTGIPLVEGIGAGISSLSSQSSARDQLRDEQNFSAYQAQLDRDFQKSEREAAQEFNLEMWNMNNEYNSPAAQLERAAAAGINPNSVISGLSGTTSSSPVTTSPSSGATASSPGSLAGSILANDIQMAYLLAQTRKTNAEAQGQEQENSYDKLTMNDRIRAAKYVADDLEVTINGKKMDNALKFQLFNHLSSKNQLELQEMVETVNKIRTEILSSKQSIKESEARVDYIESQTKGQNIQNDILAQKRAFAAATGVPEGTDVEEAVYGLIMEGRFGEVVNNFISNVEETVEDRVDTFTGKGTYRKGKKIFMNISNKVGRIFNNALDKVSNFMFSDTPEPPLYNH